MDDQRTVNFLNKQLSLRKPQYESLRILSDVLSQLGLSKDPDLEQWLTVIQDKYPTVKAFEREFPSLCFALATGVGKTRLMGAMIAWLYLTGRSRHFFILAPNLTIYEKLKQDFSLGHPKYVFKGISEFAQMPPTIITGDDYEDGRGVRLEYSIPESRSGDLFGSETAAHINIFNISKINAKDNKKGAAKSSVAKMRRLQEYIGDSYFNHLAELPDLVVMMDEAHRYYASAGAKAINDLKPILGIELTATPKTVGTKPRDFRNIIYHYPLSKALDDGYVKIPAVATRKDFNPKDYSSDDLEKIKLEDGIHHHEYVKVELQSYAMSTNNKLVKPFVLVVAQDTFHASQLKKTIESLFDGRYVGKVIEVHSNLKGDESDDNMQRLLEVEHDENTEVVIHVNKLKEGWDVTNLYTIIPLRASASEILTEQTIGRGLRLPYGKRTGVEAIDRLTIIAHDRFQDILDRAKDEESIIRKTVYIGNDDDSDIPTRRPQTVQSPSILDALLTGQKTQIDGKSHSYDDDKGPLIESKQDQKIAETTMQVIREETRKLGGSVDLNKPEVQQEITRKVQQRTKVSAQQQDLPGISSVTNDNAQRVSEIVKTVSDVVVKLTIDIPQIVVLPTREVNYGFNDFDLQQLHGINYPPVSEEILLQHLEGDQTRHAIHFGDDQVRESRPEDYIVRNLMDRNEIDYDSHAALLYKLSGQVVEHLKSQWQDEQKVENILLYYQKQLCEFIWVQMQANLWSTPTDYQGQVTQGFDVLEPNVYTMAGGEVRRDFRAPVTNKQSVKKMVFTGFKRCCYADQKFDSVDGELMLARVLEDDDSVLKWMKPASGKLRIEYQQGQRYEPDFVVETNDGCLLIEAKRKDDMDDADVQSKKRAAQRWCQFANEHAEKHGGKYWTYLLIPHDEILPNSSLKALCGRFQ